MPFALTKACNADDNDVNCASVNEPWPQTSDETRLITTCLVVNVSSVSVSRKNIGS